jgi:hypothetical protein
VAGCTCFAHEQNKRRSGHLFIHDQSKSQARGANVLPRKTKTRYVNLVPDRQGLQSWGGDLSRRFSNRGAMALREASRLDLSPKLLSNNSSKEDGVKLTAGFENQQSPNCGPRRREPTRRDFSVVFPFWRRLFHLLDLIT